MLCLLDARATKLNATTVSKETVPHAAAMISVKNASGKTVRNVRAGAVCATTAMN